MLDIKPDAKPTVIVLSGATASGKSSVVVQAASFTQGSVINADSLQLYAGLPLLTAAPSSLEQAEIEHHLYGIFPYTFSSLSVAKWENLARKAIDQTLQEKKVPWVVGGTGFYLKTLLEGMPPLPEISQQAKQDFLQQIMHIPTPTLYETLQKQDALLASRLKPQDRQRICRGLLVAELTEKPLSFWQAQPKTPPPYRFITCHLSPPRDQLRRQIRQRFEHMLECGVLEEVKTFLQQPDSLSSPLTKALGFRELKSHLEDVLSLEQATEQAIIHSHQYAKRQETWFRHQLTYDAVISSVEPGEIKRFLKKLKL